MTPLGEMTMGWTRADGQTPVIAGRLPAGVEASVLSPTGTLLGKVRDRWTLRAS